MGEGDTGYIYLDSIYKLLASPRMLSLGATPFPLGVSLGRPREIEIDVHPLLFFCRAQTDADGAAVRLSFFCLAVSSPI